MRYRKRHILLILSLPDLNSLIYVFVKHNIVLLRSNIYAEVVLAKLLLINPNFLQFGYFDIEIIPLICWQNVGC